MSKIKTYMPDEALALFERDVEKLTPSPVTLTIISICHKYFYAGVMAGLTLRSDIDDAVLMCPNKDEQIMLAVEIGSLIEQAYSQATSGYQKANQRTLEKGSEALTQHAISKAKFDGKTK
jgi:hypothetical protein